MTRTSQGSWLEELDRVDAYSDWVFEQAAPHLGKSILEIGCGRGTYTARLARSGAHVTAIDIDPEFVSMARDATASFPNVAVRHADASAEPFGAQFDTIFMLDVLEHVREDSALLAKLAQALRPGGRLVVKVPAFSWLYGAVDEAVGHCRRYSRSDLARDLSGAGLANPEVWYFNAASIPGWWLNGVVLKRAMAPSAQITLFERLLPMVKALDRLARPFVGLSVFGVAQKPAVGDSSLQ